MPTAASKRRPVLARGVAQEVRAIVEQSGRSGGLARIVSLAGRTAPATYEEMEWE